MIAGATALVRTPRASGRADGRGGAAGGHTLARPAYQPERRRPGTPRPPFARRPRPAPHLTPLRGLLCASVRASLPQTFLAG
eukprot:6342123-Prymnesium_polylepis.1